MKFIYFFLFPLLFGSGLLGGDFIAAVSTSKNKAVLNRTAVPAALGTGWYAMHFPDDDYKHPVRDSVYKKGVFEKLPEGIKVFAESYRNGGWLMSRQKQNFAGKEVYLKWKVDARYTFADIHAAIFPSVKPDASFFQSWQYLSYLSTRNEWDGSTKIPFDIQWYFTRVVIGKDGSAAGYTATGNYDNKGGELIQEYQKKLRTTTGHIGMGFGDVYGGRQAWFVLGEILIKKTTAPFKK